jgi:hypothetical protein
MDKYRLLKEVVYNEKIVGKIGDVFPMDLRTKPNETTLYLSFLEEIKAINPSVPVMRRRHYINQNDAVKVPNGINPIWVILGAITLYKLFA